MKVLSFGEILWDVFPNEQNLGGAPLNFAAHLVKTGFEASIYSSVGSDELGKKAITDINKLGVDTSYTSTISKSTGICKVSFDGDTPIYEIVANTALDNIAYTPLQQKFDGLYFGTLAQRSVVSADTLKQLFKTYDFNEKS